MGPVLIAWAASLLVLVFESDIGTSALFFGMFLIMLYVATQRTSWLLIGTSLFLVGAWAASKLVAHVGVRFAIWLHPFTYANVFCGSASVHGPCVPSYQLAQGLYGLGFGGILGTGLGHGQPYLTPLVQSDFIITAFGEELGLTGLMALLLIYGLIVQRGLRAARGSRSNYLYWLRLNPPMRVVRLLGSDGRRWRFPTALNKGNAISSICKCRDFWHVIISIRVNHRRQAVAERVNDRQAHTPRVNEHRSGQHPWGHR